MRPSRFLPAVVVALLLACPLQRSAGADESGPSAASFERALERIHEQLKKERFKPGLRALEKLLKTHKKTPHAWAHRADLEDLALRLSFGSQYGAPSADDVVSGRLLKWDNQKGYISVIYTPGTCADLKRTRDRMFEFPVPIKGPFLLQIYGKEYPYTTKTAPQIFFGGDPHPGTKKPQAWNLMFGMPRYVDGDLERWVTPEIIHRDGSRKKSIAAIGPTGAKRGKPFKLQLKATDGALGAGLNGRTWGRARKPRGVWGTVAFYALGWDRMAFTGMIEPAWIQSRLDAVVQRQLREFKRTYKPTQVLPAWLFEKGAAPKTAPTGTRRELPVALGTKHKRNLYHYGSHAEAGRWGSALNSVAKLRKDGASSVTCDFLAARAHFELGEVKQGLEEIERVLKVEPDFLHGLLLKGRLHRRRGAHEDALEAFQAATKRHAADPLVYETAVVSMLWAGRSDVADKLIAQATGAGASSEELEKLSRVLVKAKRGPTWNQVFEYKSRNYHVLSDIDKPTCKLACDLLEEAHTSYRVNLHWTSGKDTRRFKVYLFNGQAGFIEYCKDLEGYVGIPSAGVAGLYSYILKQLLIWHLPDRDLMLQAIRHEGFHQYLDRFMPDPPIWFNEGLAVYHQNARKTVHGLKFGRIHRNYLDIIREEGLSDIDDFLEQTPFEFSDRGSPSYGEAWAFVHMLRHGRSEYRSIFKQMVEALQTEPGAEVVARLFPEARRSGLEADFQTYVSGLK